MPAIINEVVLPLIAEIFECKYGDVNAIIRCYNVRQRSPQQGKCEASIKIYQQNHIFFRGLRSQELISKQCSAVQLQINQIENVNSTTNNINHPSSPLVLRAFDVIHIFDIGGSNTPALISVIYRIKTVFIVLLFQISYAG